MVALFVGNISSYNAKFLPVKAMASSKATFVANRQSFSTCNPKENLSRETFSANFGQFNEPNHQKQLFESNFS
jgi:hypothetical protein